MEAAAAEAAAAEAAAVEAAAAEAAVVEAAAAEAAAAEAAVAEAAVAETAAEATIPRRLSMVRPRPRLRRSVRWITSPKQRMPAIWGFGCFLLYAPLCLLGG